MADARSLMYGVVMSGCIQLILGTCSPGTFGDSCFYSCHCGDSCDQTTGVCGGDCDAGWVGGRGENCQKDVTRIQEAVLSLSNISSTHDTTCYTFPSNITEGNSVFDVKCDGRARYLTITHNTTTLNLCEVEIYVCSPGVFGENCSNFCHCSNEPCHPVSGVCPADCRPGWQGDRCDTVCAENHYGVSCKDVCSNRRCLDPSSSCDRYTGTCDSGCTSGWTNVDCAQRCSGSYGQNCREPCSTRKCKGSSPCDHVTGTCVSGCQEGWKGKDCKEACDSQHYGSNCDKTCASRHCVGNSSCNSTGDCDRGCETGWTLGDCTGTCPRGTFGEFCNFTCHCGETCNRTTGVCEGDCDPGWLDGNGKLCQKENVAFKKPAATLGALYNAHWSADKAVDGNRDQDVFHNSCFHSAAKFPSVWTVDLGQEYRVHDVRIYNRVNYVSRLREAFLSLSNTNSTSNITCYVFPPDTPETSNSVYDVSCEGRGRFLTITQNTSFLNLCEVETYVCSHWYFGDCHRVCHCLNRPCDPVSGVCPGDCRPGWQGDRCDTVCSNGTYGQNCRSYCSNRRCAGSSSCHHVTGSCASGCQAGWIDAECTQAYSQYGEGDEDGGEDGTVVAASISVAVFTVLVAVPTFIGVVVWRRRQRHPQEDCPADSHHYYNTTPADTDRAGESQVAAEDPADERGYEGLDVMSRDNNLNGRTYCSIETSKIENSLCVFTSDDVESRDVYVSTATDIYETIDIPESTPRDTAEGYVNIGSI
ncbi:multiple epidermal growth factor-like domains protein 10 isoform X2 [Haliotis rufescens]|uniref:multiple epidermal growth factor-like domains protein 10 isoform X2 n=1 Tax=Haliotis rufescens TaxID=6454 RepID=UPI00201F952C|nr:multiple epidermal growth factor-like domains protein 10 isoform X2 [Haliotis rufescens]